MEKAKDIKQVAGVYGEPGFNMVGNGFRVLNFFPGNYKLSEKMSPFFLLDYNPEIDFSPTTEARGVGVHPHRGFETVTISFAGKIAHHDSAGNSGIIAPGDVQWMTAGSGVLHKEYHEKEFAAQGGEFQMVQLWVNLPEAHKMTAPKYQGIRKEEMGKFTSEEAEVTVIAGEYEDVKGPASTFTPINLFTAKIKQGGTLRFSFPENYNTGVLVLKGKVEVSGENAEMNEFILFENKGTEIVFRAEEAAEILVLNGEPINEPVYHYGPFLMNTLEDIKQAFDDLNAGKFGTLEE